MVDACVGNIVTHTHTLPNRSITPRQQYPRYLPYLTNKSVVEEEGFFNSTQGDMSPLNRGSPSLLRTDLKTLKIKALSHKTLFVRCIHVAILHAVPPTTTHTRARLPPPSQRPPSFLQSQSYPEKVSPRVVWCES